MKKRKSDGSGRFMDLNELCRHTSLGRGSAMKVAKNAGAVIHVGRRVLYDRQKIDAYMETLAG